MPQLAAQVIDVPMTPRSLRRIDTVPRSPPSSVRNYDQLRTTLQNEDLTAPGANASGRGVPAGALDAAGLTLLVTFCTVLVRS